jgi:hypothetical protein
LKTYESFFWLTSNQVLETEQFAKRPTGRQNAVRDIDFIGVTQGGEIPGIVGKYLESHPLPRHTVTYRS